METNNKMRKALETLVGVIDKYDSSNPLWWHSGAKGVKPLKDARAALDETVRNCDVGTPAEQYMRYVDFCIRNSKEIGMLVWAQMMYKKGGEE